jgi:hypothetical protein
MISLALARDLPAELNAHKFVHIPGEALVVPPDLDRSQRRFFGEWSELEPDEHLKDGAQFRRRRFGWFHYDASSDRLTSLDRHSYRQSSTLNRYMGDVVREFTALSPSTKDNAFLRELIRFDFRQLPIPRAARTGLWAVDVHQIRISATPIESGQPTPEGMHRDGEDFGCIHLIASSNVEGGESQVCSDDGSTLFRGTLHTPLDTLVIWDPHVLHGVSPITPMQTTHPASRDVLLIGFLNLSTRTAENMPS